MRNIPSLLTYLFLHLLIFLSILFANSIYSINASSGQISFTEKWVEHISIDNNEADIELSLFTFEFEVQSAGTIFVSPELTITLHINESLWADFNYDIEPHYYYVSEAGNFSVLLQSDLIFGYTFYPHSNMLMGSYPFNRTNIKDVYIDITLEVYSDQTMESEVAKTKIIHHNTSTELGIFNSNVSRPERYNFAFAGYGVELWGPEKTYSFFQATYSEAIKDSTTYSWNVFQQIYPNDVFPWYNSIKFVNGTFNFNLTGFYHDRIPVGYLIEIGNHTEEQFAFLGYPFTRLMIPQLDDNLVFQLLSDSSMIHLMTSIAENNNITLEKITSRCGDYYIQNVTIENQINQTSVFFEDNTIYHAPTGLLYYSRSLYQVNSTYTRVFSEFQLDSPSLPGPSHDDISASTPISTTPIITTTITPTGTKESTVTSAAISGWEFIFVIFPIMALSIVQRRR